MKEIADLFHHLIYGILTGAACVWLDFHTGYLGDVFSGYSIWIVICTYICFRSEKMLKAILRVFLFCLGMLAAYYLCRKGFHYYYNLQIAKLWFMFLLFVPFLAALCWYGFRGDCQISWWIRWTTVIICALLSFRNGFTDIWLTAFIWLMAEEKNARGSACG